MSTLRNALGALTTALEGLLVTMGIVAMGGLLFLAHVGLRIVLYGLVLVVLALVTAALLLTIGIDVPILALIG